MKTFRRNAVAEKAEHTPMKNGFFGFGGQTAFRYPIPVSTIVIYIDGLEDLADHTENLQLIREATPEDNIRLIINSPGGCVHIAMAYIQAVRESQAMVVTHAEGMICSAGTLLWLKCGKDGRTIAPFTEFMAHNYQAGTYGDGANMYSQVTAWKKRFDKIIADTYGDVLTEEEIETIKGGGQVWLDTDDLAERVECVVLDEENINRMQSGREPIKSGPKSKKGAVKEEKEVDPKDLLGQLTQNKDLEEAMRVLKDTVDVKKQELAEKEGGADFVDLTGNGEQFELTEEERAEAKENPFLIIDTKSGKHAKIYLKNATKEDFEDFSLTDMQDIVSALEAFAEGRDQAKVYSTNKVRLIDRALKALAKIVALIPETKEENK